MFFVPCLPFFLFLFHVYGVYIPFHVCSKGSLLWTPPAVKGGAGIDGPRTNAGGGRTCKAC